MIEDPAVRAAVDEMSAAARRHDVDAAARALTRSVAAVFGTTLSASGLIIVDEQDAFEVAEAISRIESHMAAMRVEGSIGGWQSFYGIDENGRMHAHQHFSVPTPADYVQMGFSGLDEMPPDPFDC